MGFKKLAAGAAISAIILSACQKQDGFEFQKKDQANAILTGGATPSGRPFTSVTGESDLESLKKMVDPAVGENAAFAQSIDAFLFKWSEPAQAKNQGKLSEGVNKQTQTTPRQLIVKVVLSEKKASSTLKHEYFAKLNSKLEKTEQNYLAFERQTLDVKQNLFIEGQCSNFSGSNLSCEKFVFHIVKNNSQGQQVAEARGLAQSIVVPTLVRSNPKMLRGSLARLAQQMQKDPLRPWHAFEIAWGAAKFQVDLNESIALSGNALTTNELDVDLRIKTSAGLKINAQLIGNSEFGDLVISLREDIGATDDLTEQPLLIEIKNDRRQATEIQRQQLQKSVERLSKTLGENPAGHENSGPKIDNAEGDSDPNLQPETSSTLSGPPDGPIVVPSSAKGKVWFAFDASNPISQKFNKDRNQPVIQERIQKWMRERGEHTRMQNFLNRTQPNLAIVTEPFKARQLPAETIFIMLNESNYFVSDGFPVAISSSNAVGPWQFLLSTARWSLLQLKALPTTLVRMARGHKSKQAHSCDERANLRKATEAAAKYFEFLYENFPSDPKLAILSYNWGQGSVENAVKCLKNDKCKSRRYAKIKRLKEIQVSGLDYWAIRHYNMAPRESLDYVTKFVSAQFIGKSPTEYGFEVLDPKSNNYPKAPSGTCR